MVASSGARTDELDAPGGTRGPRQTAVAGQQHGVQRLGQGHVDGIVRGQVLSERPDTAEKRLVRVAAQVQGAEVVQGGHAPSPLEIALPHVPSQRLRHLDVDKVGRVQGEGGVGDARATAWPAAVLSRSSRTAEASRTISGRPFPPG